MNQSGWHGQQSWDCSSRRKFLKQVTGAATVMSFGATAPHVLRAAAASVTQQDRVIVVIEMAGGNDGLNTVIPHSNPAYQAARPILRLAKKDALAVTDSIGLHPALRGFADLLEDDRFAVVQGVGYPNPNRSHFESMDIWHSCARKSQPRYDGWLGRYLDQAGLADRQDPPALHLGAEKQPLALMSRDIPVPSIQSLEQFRLFTGDRPQLRDTIREVARQHRDSENDLLGFVQSSTSNAMEASERMESTGTQYRPDASYPASGLGKKLETVAKLIVSGLTSRIYYVRIDGFDTHANQPDAHAALLRSVGDSVNALVRDLSEKGQSDRLLVMCFSEFGRRVAQNASDGTDHGTAGPIFLAGDSVRPGLIGEHPSLTDLDQGDLRHHTDFRQVYAALLENWLACPSEAVLGGRYRPVDMLTQKA